METINKDKHIAGDTYFNVEHLKYGLRGKSLKGATVSLVAQLSTFVIQTVGTILLARLLVPHDFGLVTMVLTISLLIGNVGVNGFTEAIINAKEINHRQISTLFWINVSSSTILAIIFIACSPIVIWFYKEPLLKPIIIVIAVSNIFAGMSVQHLALLKRNMYYYRISVNDVIAAFTSTSIAIILAWQGLGYWALVAKWVIYPLAITLGAWFMCGWRPGLPVRHSGIKPMIMYSFHTFGNFMMSYFRRNIDKMLIGRSYGGFQLGYYDRAYHLSGILPTIITMPLYSVAVSTFSRLTDDPVKYRNDYLKVLSILAFIGMPLSAIMALNSNDIVLLLLGPKWVESSKILFVFSLSIGITIIYITHGWLHLSLGTPNKWFRWSIIEFIATIICFLIGFPYGALGIAVAFSASFYILIIPALSYAGNPIQLKISSVISYLWKYLLSALLAGICSWLILNYNYTVYGKFKYINIIFRISISTFICLTMYIMFIVILFRNIKPISQFISIIIEIIYNRSNNTTK